MSEPPPDTEAAPSSRVDVPTPAGGKDVKTGRSLGPLTRNLAGLPGITWSGMTVLAGVLVAIGALFIGLIAVVAFDPELESEAATIASQTVVAFALVGTALIFARVNAPSMHEALGRLGLGRFKPSWVGMAALAWLAFVLVSVVLSPLLAPEQEDITKELGTDTGSAISLIVSGLLIVIAAPLSEEIFFRGFMFAGLRRSMTIIPAALISAAVWGSLHLGAGNVGVVVQLSIFGLILAWLYERSGSLWPPVLAHGINNAIAYTLLVSDAI